MKIVANTDEGFMLQAHKDEVAQLIGFYWSGSNNFPRLGIGSNINVHEMYRYLQQLKEVETNLKAISLQLAAMSKLTGELVLPVTVQNPDI